MSAGSPSRRVSAPWAQKLCAMSEWNGRSFSSWSSASTSPTRPPSRSAGGGSPGPAPRSRDLGARRSKLMQVGSELTKRTGAELLSFGFWRPAQVAGGLD